MEQRIFACGGPSHLLVGAILVLLGQFCPTAGLPHTAAPVVEGKPFMVIWNAPVTECRRLDVPLDMSAFQAVTTPASEPDQFLTLFYKNRMALYPYTDYETLQEFHGGIPQKGNLSASLDKARADLSAYVPTASAGLALLDWEQWRPLFDRDWGTKEIYRKLSVSYARENDPSLAPQQAAARAKEQFQAAARSFMEDTLKVAIGERPNYLWGFYLFPNCYNYGETEPGYTGKCAGTTQRLNDQLLWLWDTSTALYPSVYLPTSLRGKHSAALFARNQVHEAMRVSALPKHPYTAPVYVYSQPLFRDQNELYLAEGDLVRTIGESAAVGASGSVLWGGSSAYTNKELCQNLSYYLLSTLNPYTANVTAATKVCSDMLCQSNGRCVRKDYDTDTYLHLNPQNFYIDNFDGRYIVTGVPSYSDVEYLYDNFACQCYAGRSCSAQMPSWLPMTPLVIYV
ncbi:hyaluronidase PH-20-like [Denticeps clupeoides]|uniref:Hyaluronidase n=1 Tax=Denticeps clupeoides TaxID=299321 RepID=A0AAY4BFQ7_9TELE|nr:hyaluronidase PH-20-like [Denticeps clupeoides]